MDAVVLAAGRGQRMNGNVPPFHKTLMTINGRSILVSAIEVAAEFSDRVIVVIAPENALPTICLLRDAGWADRCRFVVQPTASGPGGAMLLGADLAQSENVLILCGDNIFVPTDIGRIHAAQGDPVVGIRLMAGIEAKNFTLFRPDGIAVEKPETSELEALRWNDGRFRAWLGPLRVSKKWIEERREHLGEFIGPQLSGALLIPTDSYDISLPNLP